WVEVSSFYQYNNENELETVNNLRNIEERKKSQKALIDSEQKYSSYIENAPDGIFITDETGQYLEVNEAASLITGYDKSELFQMKISDFLIPESLEDGLSHFQMLLETGKSRGEMQYKHKDGSNRWWSVDAVKLTNHRFLGFAKDITDSKKAEIELHYIANHDSLTGLYNRRFFEEELKNLDTEQNLPISIIMCDVNGLKLINDSFGHPEGDQLLKKAADTIKKVCREEDAITRIGGDEFILLLPKTTTEESAKIANHIKELASKENFLNIELSISYGYDTKITESQSITEIISNSENHMYRHKLSERSSMRSKTINLIMNTLFEKNYREAAHSNRVSMVCEFIASGMNMDEVAINQMRIAGLIHDIGKIGIDEKILNKPGALTIDERSEVEKHPEIGWRILSATSE
ncbi:MAG: diguanylate cyclase, partial [Ignavibacteria bacterium]|nr:diguanylate cyclase [Ignavibacteria bacterium]